ncbi:hypothetical protein CHS0354_002456 [Potamilus streckersoni]|uniref:CUB domain-containing protein n=1 Tax=Potamilus streckersoni TaxID=2493646 RepID=A0AAE0T9D4_9BIVA|nr:hypothetical protein CHS0354_002456 [Potamilus streckersoni]
MMSSDVRGADFLVWMIILQACLHQMAARNIMFDMEGNACVQTNVNMPAALGVIDIAYLSANPIQVGDTQTRTTCRITLLGTEGKKLKIYVKEMIWKECGVFLRVYDGDPYFLHPKWSFTCDQGIAGGLYFTTDSKVTISLEKPSSDNKLYQFSLIVAREDGPNIGGSVVQASGGTVDTGLSIGAQAGIGIGVMLVLLVAVGLVVFCIVIWRRRREDKKSAHSMSTSYATLAATTRTSGTDSGYSVVREAHAKELENKAFSYPSYRNSSSVTERGYKSSVVQNPGYSSNDKLDKDFKEKGSEAHQSIKKSENMQDSVRTKSVKIDSPDIAKKRPVGSSGYQNNELKQQDFGQSRVERMSSTNKHDSMGKSSRRVELTKENLRESLRQEKYRKEMEKGNSVEYQRDSHKISRSESGRRSQKKSRSRSYSPSRSGYSRDSYDSRDSRDRYSKSHDQQFAIIRRSPSSRSNQKRSFSQPSSHRQNQRYDNRRDNREDEHDSHASYHGRNTDRGQGSTHNQQRKNSLSGHRRR